MPLTTAQIEADLAHQCGDSNMFFEHDEAKGTGKFLWYDNNENQWNVNTYTANNCWVEMGSMPESTFSAAK